MLSGMDTSPASDSAAQTPAFDAFPAARIEWDTDTKRQGILDSWPADVDDSAARHDWGFAPRYDFARAFNDYLLPIIRERYAATRP